MRKRGQATLFVIAGIIILAIVLLIYLFQSNIIQNFWQESISKTTALSPKTQQIDQFVQSCIKQTGEEALYWTGRQSGYFIPGERTTTEEVAYYIYKGKKFSPSREILAKELADYMNQELQFCTQGFEQFLHFTIKEKEAQTTVNIQKEKILFTVNYPLTIQTEGEMYNLENFENIVVPVRLGTIHLIAESIVQEQLENLESTCLSCLIKLEAQYNIQIDLIQEEETIVTLIDKQSKVREKPHEFTFAINIQ